MRAFWTIDPHRDPRLLLAGAAAVAAAFLIALPFAAGRPALPDFRAFEAGAERKQAFFDFTQGLVRQANAEIRADRSVLEKIAAEEQPGWLERRRLHRLAAEYGIDADGRSTDEIIDALRYRVDVVPASLALAQAAKESGWGTSRFAREGYNLFGEWCFDDGCGIVPKNRAAERYHEVEAFDSPLESVASYLHNINTHDAYRELRERRRTLRERGRPLSGLALAEALSRYSERRGAYVDEVKRLIIANDLEASQSRAGG